MIGIIGSLIVMGSVFGGFARRRPPGCALQPLELLMIGGGAFGAFCIATIR
jgi:chemotaxis protein MotA